MQDIEPDAIPDLQAPRTRRRFKRLLSEGWTVHPAGSAKNDPDRLLKGYPPRFHVELFETQFFLSRIRYDEALGFFVGYVVQPPVRGRRRIYPRIFYKDSSLLWRVGSHFVHDEHEYWVGKGDIRHTWVGDDEYVCSVEATTNLPYEIQAAFDVCSRIGRKTRGDDAVELVLKQAPSGRIEPYADFTAPRRRSQKEINGGRSVAYLRRPGDPTSLVFAPGFEPDLRNGVAGVARTQSVFFGGEMRKFRIVSTNRKIQYMFFASPTHAWMNPPQALTHELSSFGVRLVDVHAEEDLFVPGYEYHHVGEGQCEADSQIPSGFAGDPHPLDPSRADASAWLDALPIIQAFRERLL